MSERIVGNIAVSTVLAVLVSACHSPPPRELSRGHVTEVAAPGASSIPAPVRRAPFVPPPEPQVPQETYTVVVHEVPVKELLFALVRDAAIDADIHPSTDGLVTLNAVDRTLDDILGRITRQLDVRYYRRDGVLVVEPDTPVLRSYRIDYVNVARDVRSSSSTATQVAAGGEGEASLGNNSSTDIDSLSSNRFWETITAAVQGIVAGGSDDGSGGKDAFDPERSEEPEDLRRKAGARAVVIPNPESGLLLVRAPERRHREIQDIPGRGARERTAPGAHRGDHRRGRAERSPSGRCRLEPARAQRRDARAAEPAVRKPGDGAVLPAEFRRRTAGRLQS